MMKAIVYEEFKGQLKLDNLPDPVPNDDGVVIQLKASGLCLSDWHGWMGNDKDIKLPHVPGHELAGVIVEVGKNVKNFKVDDGVTVPFVSGCGNCEQCNTGNQQICDHQFQPGFTNWGSFAQYVSLNYADENLVTIPEEIDFITAASLGCRFATSFRGVVDQGKTKQDDWVVIHGCGGVGLSAIMIAKALGAKIIAIDINEDTLTLAKQLGADHSINSQFEKNVVGKIVDLTNGGANISIDALGHPAVLLNSISCLKKRGRHVQIGIMKEEFTQSKIPIDLIIGRELEIVGSHGMQAHRYNEMLEMIKKGELQPAKLVSNTVALHDVIELLPQLNTSKTAGIQIINDFV